MNDKVAVFCLDAVAGQRLCGKEYPRHKQQGCEGKLYRFHGRIIPRRRSNFKRNLDGSRQLPIDELYLPATPTGVKS
jgi:hypothetical protein